MATDVKRQIAETFEKQAKKVGVDKVTINGIVTECHISRQAFYYYYKDIVDVARYVMREGLSGALADVEEVDDPEKAVRIFAAGLAEHFPSMAIMLNSKLRGELELLMIREMKEFFYAVFMRLGVGRDMSRKRVEFQADFMACGMAAFSIEHCNDLKFDSEEFARNLWEILRRDLGK